MQVSRNVIIWRVYKDRGNYKQFIPFLYLIGLGLDKPVQPNGCTYKHVDTARWCSFSQNLRKPMPKDHPCKIIWLSSVTCEPLKHWGGMLETCAAALSRHSASSFRNDYSLIPQIPPLTFRLQFSMWLLPPPEDENGFHASQNVILFIGDRTPESRVCGTGRWYIHATAGFRIETSNYFSRLCLYTPRFSQGQVSFKVNVQSIRFLLSASKNWRSEPGSRPVGLLEPEEQQHELCGQSSENICGVSTYSDMNYAALANCFDGWVM